VSFNATVYRVLIASPGDLHEERGVIEEAIYHWNATHAVDDKVVLLPVRWETHSVPELGDRPQAILNRRVVAGCDILIGAFWTRLGTPTGMSDSGTMEEIEQFLQAGKPVLLYFSSREIDPDRVDLDQLKNLRDAKSRLMQRGLVEQFVSPPELRWKLARHLQEQVRRMVELGSAPPTSRSAEQEPNSDSRQETSPAQKSTLWRGMDEQTLNELYESYWQAFSVIFQKAGTGLRVPTAGPRSYVRISLGSSHMRMNAFASVRDRLIGVELVLAGQAGAEPYARLKNAQSVIEQELRSQLEWKELPSSNRIVRYDRGFDPVNRNDWERQHNWLIEQLKGYQESLLKRIADGKAGNYAHVEL
jgi:hypothetical protein